MSETCIPLFTKEEHLNLKDIMENYAHSSPKFDNSLRRDKTTEFSKIMKKIRIYQNTEDKYYSNETMTYYIKDIKSWLK